VKVILVILGIILVITGGIWFFQGINVIKGSFMTAQGRWAIYGGITVVAGVGLIVLGARRKMGPRGR
jgi:hypothetical protein